MEGHETQEDGIEHGDVALSRKGSASTVGDQSSNQKETDSDTPAFLTPAASVEHATHLNAEENNESTRNDADDESINLEQYGQGYRAPYNETLAPPNGPLTRLIRPPIAFPPDSKRAQLIEDAEEDLEQDMDELKAAAHEYNVAIQLRLDAIKDSGRALEQRIRLEHAEMEASVTQLRQTFTKQFQTAFVELEQRTLSHFARVENHQMAVEEKRIRECDQQAKTFYYTTVPEIMERVQGEITRRLEKNHETFDIENAKIQKRERKTCSQQSCIERKTGHLFEAEHERRINKFQDVKEDLHHLMRVTNRESERTQCNQVNVLQELMRQLNEEHQVRETEDFAILDKLGMSFNKLQTSIMENLGDPSSPNTGVAQK